MSPCDRLTEISAVDRLLLMILRRDFFAFLSEELEWSRIDILVVISKKSHSLMKFFSVKK